MHFSRCVLPLLALYLQLDEVSAAALPSHFTDKREANWPDQELLSHQPDQMDLSVGDAGDMIRDMNSRPTLSEILFDPEEHLSLQAQHQKQFQYQHKANEKRRKVAPLDSISSFRMSGMRKRKDEPEIFCGSYSN